MIDPLPPGPFATVLADPPWEFATRSPKGDGRSARRHYDVMTLDDIKALPVRDVVARDATLFLWATDTHLAHALDVMKAWGFTYKTVGFYWVKLNPSAPSSGLEPFDFFTGMGYWTRANPEQCLLGTRGNPKRYARDVSRLVLAPRREHSRKPDAVPERIERLVAPPYLELFGRRSRDGWYVWGDQAMRFDSSPDG